MLAGGVAIAGSAQLQATDFRYYGFVSIKPGKALSQ